MFLNTDFDAIIMSILEPQGPTILDRSTHTIYAQRTAIPKKGDTVTCRDIKETSGYVFKGQIT